MSQEITTPEPKATRSVASPDIRADLLEGLVSQWGRALDDPAELRVAPTVGNLTIALDLALRTWLASSKATAFRRSAEMLPARLAAMLLEAIEAAEGDAALLWSLHESELSALKLILSADLIEVPQATAILAPLIKTIEAPLEPVGQFLAENLVSSANSVVAKEQYYENMEAVAPFVARSVLLHDQPGALRKSLPCWLSSGSTSAIIEACASSLTTDTALLTELSERSRELANRLSLVELRGAPLDDAPLNYAELWQIAAAIHSYNGAAQQEVVERLAAHIHSGIIAQPLFRALIRVFGDVEKERRAAWDALDAVATPIERWFADRGWIQPRDGYPAWRRIVRDATCRHVVHSISRGIAGALKERCRDSLVDLESWLKRAAADTVGLDQRGVLWYLASREIQKSVLAFRTAARAEVFAETERKIADFGSGNAEMWGVAPTWDNWISQLAATAGESDSAWRQVRWDRFSAPQLATALAPLRQAFAASTDFDVVTPVTGATTEPHAWRAGGLGWYTASTHSLGEAFHTSPDLDTKNLIHVWQRVRATTVHAAHEKAQVGLEPALSALSFGLSAGERATGFRPGSDIWFAWGNPVNGAGGFRGSRHRTESADRTVSGEHLVALSEAYGPLIEHAAAGTPLTELENRLVRALFWYRSGRWQRNHVRRFLDHFVALEHLFASGLRSKKEEAVATGVAALEGSWRFRGWAFQTRLRPLLDGARRLSEEACADEAIGALTQAVALEGRSRAANAVHWRTHLSPWLSPSFVEAVVAALPSQPPPEHWLGHLSKLRQAQEREPQWQEDDRRRQQHAWFKLHLLAQRRHAIVHDAATYLPAIELEADALTEVVEHVIRHLAEDVLNRPGTADSMRHVIDDLVPPWLH